MYRICAMIAMMLLAVMIGCDKPVESPPPIENPDSAYLLGLNRDHQLHYIIYDSIVSISFDETDTVFFDTTNLDIGITRGPNNQVEISVGGLPHDLLTIDDIGVLHSGQIRSQVMPPDTLFFYPTPLIMPRKFIQGSTWYIDSPPYSSLSGEIRRTLLYFNYGYFTERSYLGQENVVLPTHSYNTFHFRSLLFADESSSDTLISVDEYYAPGVGPVKLIARIERSQRLIILLEDE